MVYQGRLRFPQQRAWAAFFVSGRRRAKLAARGTALWIGFSGQEGGIAMGDVVGGIKAESGGDPGDGFFVGAFHFDEAAQAGNLVEADDTIFQPPALAVFLDLAAGVVAQAVQQGLGLVRRADVQLDFFAVFERPRLAGAFEAEDGFGLAAGFFPPQAEAAAAGFKAQVVPVEEGVKLAGLAEKGAGEFFQAGGEFVQPLDFDFGFDFD